MNIAVIGTGYVGLVTGACFAEFGNDVICVDKDTEKIKALRACKVPIYEPGLETLVAKNMNDGRLHFDVDIPSAVKKSLIVFVAVGTPPNADGSADLTQIEAVTHEIARSMNAYKVIVTKSTVPVGAAGYIRRIIQENKPAGVQFSIAANPEFLREGDAINDFQRPDRVVIGCTDEAAVEILKDLYRPLYVDTPFIITTPESAEMIKYASNAFLATKVSFMNEIANLCDAVGADVHDVARGVGTDGRIGAKFLHPGPGFGGSCFPKDAKALVALAHKAGCEMQIVSAVLQVNDRQKAGCIDRIRKLVPELKGKTIAVLGLSFKPETDDMRDSPAIKIVEDLVAAGARVQAYDPAAMEPARSLLPAIHYCKDEYEAACGSDALIVVTEWNQFRSLDFDRLGAEMRQRNIIDLRNVYDPHTVQAAGFSYVSVGRGEATPASE